MHDQMDTLQEMADRLGREVETFAESLDRFLDELQANKIIDECFTFDMVHDFVLELGKIAEARAKELQVRYERELRDEQRREWAEQAKLSTSSTKSVLTTSFQSRSISTARAKELRKYLEEVDTWELFRIMLEHHYRPFDDTALAERREKLAKLDPVNRYTSEHAIYDRFLLENDLAQERARVKAWLEHAAGKQQPEIKDIMAELQAKSKNGSAMWTFGWAKTRDKIKAEKRQRTWPAPDSSPLPQMRSLETSELLVTSLDPDARTRQGRSLEKPDAYYEHAVWIVCWEQLRRGTPWHKVADWAETNNIGFRAALLGSGMADHDAPTLAGFRRACFLASQEECSNEYEAAVFGLIGGNLAAMQPVCRTVDDHLFAHYSAALTHQFDQYLLVKHPDRMAPSLAHPDDSITDPATAQQEILELITKMRTRPETQKQSVSPLKMIQSYLLANEAESLIHTLGVAIAADDALAGISSAIATTREADSEMAGPEAVVIQDPISLRIVTHISVLLQLLRHDKLAVEEQEMEDNLVITYVHELNVAGKRDLTPLYASMLQAPCYTIVMAEVLPDVTGSKDKQDIVALMLQRGMNVPAVLGRLLRNNIDVVQAEREIRPKFTILRNTSDERWPGQQIDLSLFPDTASPAQEALVNCLEWYLLLPDGWNEAFDNLAFAMHRTLLLGLFACARLIVETYRSSKVASIKAYQDLGRSVQILAVDGLEPEDAAEAELWQSMRQRAKTYMDYERLIDVFEALHAWRTQEELYTKTGRALNAIPADLKGAFAAVQDAMEPILDPEGFMLQARDESEAESFAVLRRMYVTEAIIAYNVVLHAAGCMISRDALLTSMDLATVVATETTGLTETFVEAKRMKELVTSFAQSSKRILVLKNTGKTWKPKYDRSQGKDAGIWDITTRPSNEAVTKS
ncbi:hypothetical protein AMS68_006971 [Peltaster fructicola]|uniref:Nuclear pore complex protein n=1 Tax=Peltaster fructicola TaxID=286661 RepID=A0A6H0Y370_9PEZI|nr:hypothetical protein AMS68_006971 [Peltaster fructicola]